MTDNTRFGRKFTSRVVPPPVSAAVNEGFAHGRVHLFAQDGTLMAATSQSMIVRIFAG
ncbi:hypothetical protein [Sandarakinorhabdus sp.]|uniref:hypothetical protein n=1 Tax=Sandarakinorhabdus sp. TaxID=1916663 RepID=UPI003F6EACB1